MMFPTLLRPDYCVSLIDKQDQVIALFDFVDNAADSLFKHAPKHGPATMLPI
jgi:hypothetical protein